MSETLDATNEDQRTASQMLSEARVAMGLSQEEVAQELYLIPSYIRHIDDNEIEKIDKQAFVRGYLRSYAKLVHLDGDDMVARYEKTQGVEPQKIEIRAVTQEPVGSTNFTGPVIQTAVMGLVGFVVVMSLVWFLVSSGDDEAEPPVVAADPVVSETVEASPSDEPEAVISDVQGGLADSAEENAENIVAEASDAAQLETNADDVEASSVEQNLAADAEQVVAEVIDSVYTSVDESVEDLTSAADSVVDAVVENADSTEATQAIQTALERQPESKEISINRADGVIRVSAGGNDELSFSFTDECWVEIEDGEGHAIYGDLNRAGDELIVTGTGPFEVLFGKAPAVTMSYNGEAFDLAPHTTSVDTAKVKVGN